jgi:hypothetical protein
MLREGVIYYNNCLYVPATSLLLQDMLKMLGTTVPIS